jgi:hypothetical protein
MAGLGHGLIRWNQEAIGEAKDKGNRVLVRCDFMVSQFWHRVNRVAGGFCMYFGGNQGFGSPGAAYCTEGSLCRFFCPGYDAAQLVDWFLRPFLGIG